MKLKKIKLVNFRNHTKLEINFGGETFLIYGPNGSGKSNILEAIYLMSTTKSLRSRHDLEMISHDSKHCDVELIVESEGQKIKLEMTIIDRTIVKSLKVENLSSKKVKINGVTKALNKFAGTFNSVLFAPQSIEMFSATPSVRRKYIDSLFFQVDYKYKQAHLKYLKSLRQRNKLLEQVRDFGRGKEQIEFWEEKLIESGKIIQEKRNEFFSFLQKNMTEYIKKLNEVKTDIDVLYLKNEISENRIEKYKEKEIYAKTTLIGPHRDDFKINVSGFDLSSFGSRGQQRSTLLAIKLCEIDFITQITQKRPVLLLDDIFSELDEKHRGAILEVINLQQTIITSAEPHEHIDGFMKKVKFIEL